MACEAAMCAWIFRADDIYSPTIPWRYTKYHDLESLWWTLVHILYTNDDSDNMLTKPDARLARIETRERLFPQDVSFYYKNLAALAPRVMYLENPCMHNDKPRLASSLEPVHDVVVRIAAILLESLKKADEPEDMEDLDAHGRIRELFEGEFRDEIEHIRLIQGIKVREGGVVRIVEKKVVPSFPSFEWVFNQFFHEYVSDPIDNRRDVESETAAKRNADSLDDYYDEEDEIRMKRSRLV
jgi:hypothetical protein